jgi:hypothetical protein
MMLMNGARPVPVPKQVQALAGQRVVDQQRAGGLAAHDDGVAHLDVLQLRGERAFFHLDAQELEVLLVVRAHDAVGAQQGLVVDLQADHREMTVREAQRRVARGGEGEQAVGPVVDAQDAFFAECTHTELKSWLVTGEGLAEPRCTPLGRFNCGRLRTLHCRWSEKPR